MQITHFGHACVLVEVTGTRVLLDPGSYSTGFEDLRDLDLVLVTHEHPDHLDLDRLPALLNANPRAELLVDSGAGRRLGEAGLGHRVLSPGDTDKPRAITVDVLGGRHAVIHPKLPEVSNNGYLLDSLLLHPGDAFPPAEAPVDVLLLPVGGPWMKLSEAIDYLHAVRPGVVIPIHQAGLAPVHQQLHHQLLTALAPDHTEVVVLEPGVPGRL